MPAIGAGAIVTSEDVEAAALETLKTWLPYYLSELDDQQDRERGTTKPPRTYTVVSEDDRWLEQTPPALIVASPGTTGDMERHGDHASYSATWELHVIVIAGGATEPGTRALAHRYAAAVATLFGQQPDLSGLAEMTWVRSYTSPTHGVPVGERRRIMACEVVVDVRIPHIFSTRGPTLPREAPDPPTDPAVPTITPTGSRVEVTRT